MSASKGLALIMKSWTSEQRFSHHGRFWHFEDIIVEPPTAQKPHPPIWMGAGSPDSIRKVARRGAKLLLDQHASMALTLERFNVYRDAIEKMGRRFDPMDVGVSRAFFVAKDAEEKAKAIATRFANQQRLVKADASPGGQKSTASLLSFDQTLDAAGDSALFGTPDEIAAKLEMLRSAGISILLNGPTGSRDGSRLRARRDAGVHRCGVARRATACEASASPSCRSLAFRRWSGATRRCSRCRNRSSVRQRNSRTGSVR